MKATLVLAVLACAYAGFWKHGQEGSDLIGFGAGRSTLTCRLVLQDANRKELSNARIYVRGNLTVHRSVRVRSKRARAPGIWSEKGVYASTFSPSNFDSPLVSDLALHFVRYGAQAN
jgi:hypothetical protein